MTKASGSCDWEVYATFGDTSTERFKFDINADWSHNYGDNGANGSLERWGQDIFITQGAGEYKITINDRDLTYSIEKQ
jgi:hypothetical protein